MKGMSLTHTIVLVRMVNETAATNKFSYFGSRSITAKESNNNNRCYNLQTTLIKGNLLKPNEPCS